MSKLSIRSSFDRILTVIVFCIGIVVPGNMLKAQLPVKPYTLEIHDVVELDEDNFSN